MLLVYKKNREVFLSQRVFSQLDSPYWLTGLVPMNPWKTGTSPHLGRHAEISVASRDQTAMVHNVYLAFLSSPRPGLQSAIHP